MDVGGRDREGALVGLGGEVEVMDVGHGAFAEYLSVPQRNLAHKPVNLTFEQVRQCIFT